MIDNPLEAPMHSDTIQSFTHRDFVAGLQANIIGCLLGEPYMLQKGPAAAMFVLLSILYAVCPLIFIPLWAYHAGDWLLLVGLAISFLATKSAAQYSRSVFYFLCYCIGFWLRNGFSLHQRTTFYFFCALSGYLLWQLADSFRLSSARSALINNPVVYSEALAQNRLRIVNLGSSQNMILPHDDIDASFTVAA